MTTGLLGSTIRAMHTHFASATNAVATFLVVVIVGTAWRLGGMHLVAKGAKYKSRLMEGLGKAMLFQY